MIEEQREDRPGGESALVVRETPRTTTLSASARRLWGLARQVRPSREVVALGTGLAVLGAGGGVVRAISQRAVPTASGGQLDLATAATVTRTVRRVLAHRVVTDGATTIEVREAYVAVTETIRTVTGK